jgi:hypothetical protein
MIAYRSKCERCHEVEYVELCYYRDNPYLLCPACAPHIERFGAYQLRVAHYEERGGFIYGAPWWDFNEPTEEDKLWESETFPDGVPERP